MKSILPIDLTDGVFLDPKHAFKCGESFRHQYVNASPFPHTVVDDLLPPGMSEELLANFPAEPLVREKHFDGYYEHKKRQVSPYYCKRRATELFMFFNSEPFLQFLEGMTGIEGLIPDPYFEGAGYHETGRGGKLGIHADFRLHKRMHLARRLNLLVYLNKDWSPEYGGQLELWASDMTHCVKKVLPVFNRCVLFSTDATSFHGHPDPLTCPEDVTRKSIALYYYTASQKIYEELPDKGTDFRPRDKHEEHLAKNVKPNKLKMRIQRLRRKLLGKRRDA